MSEIDPIIIVDDSKTNLILMESIVSDMGEDFDLILVQEGYKLIDLLRTTRASLIVLDIMMPEMDGIALLERLREEKDLEVPPVIMLTAMRDMEKINRCLELGAVKCIQKPIIPQEIISEISILTQHQNLR